MEYEKRVHSEAGSYIVAGSREFEDILSKEVVEIGGFVIKPGDKTDLHGWFKMPCRYCGLLVDDVRYKQAIFYIGEGNPTLFSPSAFYYDITYVFDPARIGKCYKQGTFRDAFMRLKPDGSYYWK
jgi:hypothetical protein